tara:strand:- start:137 stop:673 length:537 start_codon:yes stop_codon:yes gene_type:complete
MKDNISGQTKESILTKEESKTQLDLEIKKRKEFRNKITELESSVVEHGMDNTELHEVNQVKHTFAGGCYIRELACPAGQLIITKIHKKEHPFFLMKGYISILTHNGIEHVKAPYQGVTKPGTKRAVYVHEDCIFTTVHATYNDTVEEVEEEVVCASYNDLPVECDPIKILESINLKIE